MEESELHKFNIDLITGEKSEAAEEARERARKAVEAKRAILRLVEIPQQLRLRIPPALKQVVLDEYERVFHQGAVLPLPRNEYSRPTVSEIVDEWKDKMLKSDGVVDDEQISYVEKISESLISYFNLGLRQFLLYHNEVAMCDEVCVMI